MIIKNMTRIIFILIFLLSLYCQITSSGNASTQGWLGLIPLACLILFSFKCKYESKKARIFFIFFAAIDFLSGLSFFINMNKVKMIISILPSSSWMVSLIYILKAQQYQLFRIFAMDVILWMAYAFQLILFCKNNSSRKVDVRHKKVTVSSVTACINFLIFLVTVIFIFNNHWVDMELQQSSLSYNQVYVTMIFFFLAQSYLPSIILSIIGLIGEKKSKYRNSFGKISNEIFLVFYMLAFFGMLIIGAAWY